MAKKLVLAVPNFSEGRRREVIEHIVDAVRNAPRVRLLDYSSDMAMNRTVVSVAGPPAELAAALLEMTRRSVESIDMEKQKGAHPRIGAQDTLPLYPLHGTSLEECIALAERLGRNVYEELGVPVYFAGENARAPERRALEDIRHGGYEGLKEDVSQGKRLPDLGDQLHPTAAAVIVSAGTSPLVAYNVILDTQDLTIAKRIARAVRGPSGGFSRVRAIGFSYEDRDAVGVSMNVFDYEATPLYRLFNFVENEARRYGVSVIGSEIVGLAPQKCLVQSLEYYLRLDGFKDRQITENHLLDLMDDSALS
jgi:glutamate formiminotransferase